MTTAKYVLKTDRTKTVDVKLPVFTFAVIVGADGKESEIARSEFEQLYEPVLPKVDMAGVDVTRPGSSTPAVLQDIQSQLAELAAKVDAIHAIVVPQRPEGQ